MVFRSPDRFAWSAEKAYEKASQAGWVLFFLTVPVITLMTGCLGCLFVPGNSRNLIILVLVCFAFILTHLIFIAGVSLRKRWGILGLLILCGLENIALLIWMILLFGNLGWRQELIGSLTLTLVFLAVGSVMVLMYWNIIRAVMATRHAIQEDDPRGFDVILKSAEVPKEKAALNPRLNLPEGAECLEWRWIMAFPWGVNSRRDRIITLAAAWAMSLWILGVFFVQSIRIIWKNTGLLHILRDQWMVSLILSVIFVLPTIFLSLNHRWAAVILKMASLIYIPMALMALGLLMDRDYADTLFFGVGAVLSFVISHFNTIPENEDDSVQGFEPIMKTPVKMGEPDENA